MHSVLVLQLVILVLKINHQYSNSKILKASTGSQYLYLKVEYSTQSLPSTNNDNNASVGTSTQHHFKITLEVTLTIQHSCQNKNNKKKRNENTSQLNYQTDSFMVLPDCS